VRCSDTAGIGAGIALAPLAEHRGRLITLGTPAEVGGGGKLRLLGEGPSPMPTQR